MKESEVQERELKRRLATLAGAIVVLLALGTAGYCITEGVSVWRGFTWTLDNVATIGSIPEPEDTAGQIMRVLLTLLGVGTLFYALVSLTELVVTGELSAVLAHRRALRMTARLSDHFIICGFGRVGRQVARDLRAAGAKFVIVDGNPDNREHAGVGVRFILSTPSEDAALRDAGIERARAVLACVDSDLENIFIALTARELRPDISIVARAALEESESKLRPRRGRPRSSRPIGPPARRWRAWRCTRTSPARWTSRPSTGSRRSRSRRDAPASGARSATSAAAPTSSASGAPTAPSSPSRRRRPCCASGDVVMAIGTPRTLARLEGLFDPERPELAHRSAS